jgi:DNA-binding NtrC family response regulator
MPSLLIVDDNVADLNDLVRICGKLHSGMTVRTSSTTASAMRLLSDDYFATIVSPVQTPSVDGLLILKEAQTLQPRTPVVLHAQRTGWMAWRKQVMDGAFELILKPFEPDLVLMALKRAINVHELRSDNHLDPEECSLLRVEGLGPQATVALVKTILGPFGKVLWVRLVVDSVGPTIVYAELNSKAHSEEAIRSLNGRTVLGYTLTISACRNFKRVSHIR